MSRLWWSNLTRGCRLGSLGLCLGLAASTAAAGDVQWHAARDAKPAPETAAPAPAVTMQAPVPLSSFAAERPSAPDAFRRVSFSGSADAPAPVVFRAQMSDAPRALPLGPEGPGDPPARKTSGELPMPQGAGTPGVMSFGADCGACGCGPCDACNPDGCGRFGVDDCCGVPPNNRLWVSGEYLLWWIKGQTLPALVTTGSTADAVPGALYQPGTAVLYGNGHVENDARSGGRFRLGWWFDDDHTVGLDGGFFFLGQRSVNFNAGSFGSPALFRPFFNPGFVFNSNAGTFVPTSPFEDAEAVAFPGVLAGAVSVTQKSRLWGYEANLRTNLCNGCCKDFNYSVDGYVGFRSLGLDESIDISENLVSLSPAMPGNIVVADRFATSNRFYGGQLGLDSELRYGKWFLDLSTKVGLGNVHQVVNITGSTLVTDPTTGASALSQGGLLAQSSNIGRYTHDRFAVLPEVGLNFGYQLTPGLRCFVGYNFLYLSSVVRPAQQIDRVVNPTFIPLNGSAPTGPARPAFTLRDTDFYAQGINLGLEFRW